MFSAVADLQVVSPWRGLGKTVVNLALLPVLFVIALSRPSTEAFVLWSLMAGLYYASAFVTTHDAIHRTLTGWNGFDEVTARVLSYVGLWPHCLYHELHVLHHKMNGSDPQDPERPQWTEGEYRRASPLVKWYVRNQWALDMFVLGGFGFIGKHAAHGIARWKNSPAIRHAIISDVAGILVQNGIIYAIAIHYGAGLRYLMMYLIMERIVGMVHQFRSHIEHYGLWGRRESGIETQIFCSRNLRTNELASFYFNRLNYHSVHHAFPRIPFYHLREAHERLARLLGDKGSRLPEDQSYFATAIRLARHPVVIRETDVVPISSLR